METTRRTYIVIVGRNPQDLENKVIEKIQEGYAPFGGFGVTEVRLYQPMVWRKGLDNG
jgi:hypothetical protein